MDEEVGEDRASLALDSKKIDFGAQAPGNGIMMLVFSTSFAHNLPFTAHEAISSYSLFGLIGGGQAGPPS